MTTNNEQYAEQVRVLQERFPQAPTEKLTRLLRRHDGNADKVGERLFKQDWRSNRCESLETRFGASLTALQQDYPMAESMKRMRLLKIMERYDGDVEQVGKFLQRVEGRQHNKWEHSGPSRRQLREELRTKYAAPLAELATAGIDVKSPCVLRLLEKNQGDANKVIEIKARRNVKKEQHAELDAKYASQVAQLEADGIGIKNRRLLARLLEKSNGEVDAVKQLLNERKEKHLQRREYRQKHRSRSPITTGNGEKKAGTWRKRWELSRDDLENLKRLRSAGVHGNPRKMLTIFHECDDSIELTKARTQEEQEKRAQHRNERVAKREVLAEAKKAYITLDKPEDWPRDIEQVYLDGNNMMFVVDSLRRLCLNRAGQKTERAIGEIAAAWKDQMHIPNIELIFDSTRQLQEIGTVKVSSAQPQYRTTDDMLVEIARRPENHEKNKRTVIVTSDRALAALLQHEGCLLIKPYSWFAHCVMVLTPDLVKYEEVTGLMTTASTPTTFKTRYNFDELVHRVANIDL